MTTLRLPILAAVAAIFSLTVGADAAKPGKQKRNERQQAERILARFDSDGDRTLSGKEADRIRTMFNTFKALDTDRDGQLSDSEISAAKVGKKQSNTKGEKKQKKGKKARKD